MQKFFLKRVRKFIIYMFIPLIIVFIMSIFILFKNTHQDIIQQGKQTVDAVSTNFEVVISNILYQNDLLSNTTRMSIALRKMLSQSEMSYSDAIHISSLRSILNSISSTHDYVDSIYLYLDSYESYFSSDGGVRNLTNSNDTTWLTNYLSMDQDMNFLMTTRNSNNLVDSLRSEERRVGKEC